MERVQRPDGATSGVKVQPLSKGIGEGTVQRTFLGVRNFSPRRSRRPSGGRQKSSTLSLWKSEAPNYPKRGRYTVWCKLGNEERN